MNRHQTKYLNTAKKMNQALIRLLKTQAFSTITIKDICAEACVNRSTFYSHYENMADLLEDTRQYITSLFPAHHLTLEFSSSSGDLTIPALQDDFLISILKVFAENRAVFLIPHFYPDPYQYPSEYKYILEELTIPYYKSKGIHNRRTMEYLLQFFYSGTHAIIYKWMRDGCQESYTEICHLIRMCFQSPLIVPDTSDPSH